MKTPGKNAYDSDNCSNIYGGSFVGVSFLLNTRFLHNKIQLFFNLIL